jgi:biotin-(acetyl-CoA carboxylase) ligase
LVESVFGADGYAAIGVGLTLAAPPEGSVNPGVAPIRGLEDMAARPISRERLLAALLDALEARLHDVVAAPDLLRAEYRARDALLGRTVGFETQEGTSSTGSSSRKKTARASDFAPRTRASSTSSADARAW